MTKKVGNDDDEKCIIIGKDNIASTKTIISTSSKTAVGGAGSAAAAGGISGEAATGAGAGAGAGEVAAAGGGGGGGAKAGIIINSKIKYYYDGCGNSNNNNDKNKFAAVGLVGGTAASSSMETSYGGGVGVAGAGRRGGESIISIDDAIDRLGCGKFQYIILLAAGLCFAADAIEVTLLSFLSAILKMEWNLSSTQAAFITSSVFFGQIVGTVVLGRLGDAIGRRPVFLVSALLIGVFGVWTAFVKSYIGLVLMRSAVGFGVGGSVVPFDILAEFLPSSKRGQYLLYVEYFWTFGSMFVPILAYWSVGHGHSWNVFVFLCALPCFISVIVGYWYVPESPRWLLSMEKYEEALNVLRIAAYRNGLHGNVIFPNQGLMIRQEEHEEEKGFKDLFTRKWRKLTLLIWGTWVGFGYGYIGTILIVTKVFQIDDDTNDTNENDANNNTGGGGNVVDDGAGGGGEVPSFDYTSIFISCSAEFIGNTLVILLVDRIGRVKPQVFSYIMGGFFVFVLTSSINSEKNWLIGATIVAFMARVFEMCATCLTWVSTAEVYTTEIRTTGHSAANAIARGSAFLSPFLVESDTLSLKSIGIIMLFIHLFTAFCAYQLPETMGIALGSSSSRRSGVVDGRGGIDGGGGGSDSQHLLLGGGDGGSAECTLLETMPATTTTTTSKSTGPRGAGTGTGASASAGSKQRQQQQQQQQQGNDFLLVESGGAGLPPPLEEQRPILLRQRRRSNSPSIT